MSKNIFLIRAIFLLLILAIADFIIGSSLDFFYKKTLWKTTYSLYQTNEEILIFGSSRASHHYDPRIFSDELDLTCFNSGYDGKNIYYHYALLVSILSRHTPDVIILDINSSDFMERGDLWSTDGLDILLPYYKNESNDFKDVVKLRSPSEKLKMLSCTYPYNSKIIDIAKGYIAGRDQAMGIQGFNPLIGTRKTQDNRSKSLESEEIATIDEQKVQYIQRFIDLAIRHDIQLYIIASPNLNSFDTSKIQSIVNKNDVVFWDYSDNPNFMTGTYFKDGSHMNKLGAELFSKVIASRIKENLHTDKL
ncbi:hypothetical protein [Mariniphaga sediminis]|uniref:hypothetical protein n=1 Tax=Mariniphaga sediminis TaxID=1628158 RepID=UPI003565851D